MASGKPSRSAAPRSETISVVVIAQAELLRRGLERLLATHARVTSMPRLHHALPGAARADVAVVSDRGAEHPAELCKRVLDELAENVVLVHGRPDVGGLLDVLAAGVRCVVAEEDGAASLREAVTAAASGEHYLGGSCAATLLASLAEGRRDEPRRSRLADHDLLQMLAEGHSASSIANLAGLTEKTIRNRSSQLYRSLGVRSRREAVRVAQERGLLD